MSNTIRVSPATSAPIKITPTAVGPVKLTMPSSQPITLTTTGGVSGPPGRSAYQVAVANGFVGTEQQWLFSLSQNVELPDLPDLSLIFDGALL